MKAPNTKCFNCGKSFYVCHSCIDLYSWKHICCSIECYREHIKKELEKVNKNSKQKEKKNTLKKNQPEIKKTENISEEENKIEDKILE